MHTHRTQKFSELYFCKLYSKNKAQIIGQVIMFVLAIIIFALITIYGYKAITKFLGTQQDVALATFVQDFTNGVEGIKREFGSVIRLELSLPGKYTKLCIADSDASKNWNSKDCSARMKSTWETGTQNIFLLPDAPTAIKINDITTEMPSSQGAILPPSPTTSPGGTGETGTQVGIGGITDQPITIPGGTMPGGVNTCFCINNPGKIRLRLEGLGDKVAVTKWVD